MRNQHFVVAEYDGEFLLIPFTHWENAKQVYLSMEKAEYEEGFDRWDDLYMCDHEGRVYELLPLGDSPQYDMVSKRVDVSRWNKRN